MVLKFDDKTKEETFAKIIEGVEIKNVLHYMFFMKNKEYYGDIDTDLGTMYFSYLKVWGIFKEKFEMSHEEVKEFLCDMMILHFNFSITPY